MLNVRSCLGQYQRLFFGPAVLGHLSLSFRVCNVASETEEALAMWLALWLRCIVGGNQRDCKLGPFVSKMLSYRNRGQGEWGCVTN